MDLKQIKDLIDLFAATDLGELQFSEDGYQLRLVRHASVDVRHVGSSSQAVAPLPVAGGDATPVTADAKDNAKEVVAPLHGVLHLTPTPDEPPFVKLGDPVQAGQTLGVLEAMKMFHTLKSGHSGTVAAILATSGSEVEAGQPLFRILSRA